ncbi:MAG: hypothetical protein KGQ41_03540 [Alphaproteobacteria bacterium]|nr:hypothetical protein [Alphaproteobacteria bacterium]
MLAKAQFAVSTLGIGQIYDDTKLAREVLADAMPTLLHFAHALNYAHFKMLGTSQSLPGGLNFSYGPEAITEATYDVGKMVAPDYYEKWFMFKHDAQGCSITTGSYKPLDNGVEATFDVRISGKGTFVVTTSNQDGKIINTQQTNSPTEIIGMCGNWIARNFNMEERKLVGRFVTRLAGEAMAYRGAGITPYKRFVQV